MPVPGDRPLAQCLDFFWQGRIPSPVESAEGEGEPASVVDELAASGITLRGRPLEALLAPAYRRFTDAG
ncbi:hypothetical protein [Kitasatospora sp. NPDC059327]|uniref:hypothetical protein n=1 Tax=Kitasatospora sp. NPDC059327 TaxID=3346803 RepID=UPI0036C3F284